MDSTTTITRISPASTVLIQMENIVKRISGLGNSEEGGIWPAAIWKLLLDAKLMLKMTRFFRQSEFSWPRLSTNMWAKLRVALIRLNGEISCRQYLDGLAPVRCRHDPMVAIKFWRRIFSSVANLTILCLKATTLTFWYARKPDQDTLAIRGKRGLKYLPTNIGFCLFPSFYILEHHINSFENSYSGRTEFLMFSSVISSIALNLLTRSFPSSIAL